MDVLTETVHIPRLHLALHRMKVLFMQWQEARQKSLDGPLDHPVMYISLNVLGSMVLDVNSAQLDASFIDDTGTIQDYFTIVKGGSVISGV